MPIRYEELKRRLDENPRLSQFMRFCVNGGVSAGIHYGVYVVAMHFMQLDLAYSVGYVISFIYNFPYIYIRFKVLPLNRY